MYYNLGHVKKLSYKMLVLVFTTDTKVGIKAYVLLLNMRTVILTCTCDID